MDEKRITRLSSRLLLALLWALFLIMALPGCTMAGQTISSTPMLPPATTGAPTATIEKIPLSTGTLPPTRNLTPWAARPRPTLTPRPTLDPATPTPEPDFAATLVAGFSPRLFATYPSPDGSLQAEVFIYDCANLTSEQAYAYEVLRVVETAGGATHDVDDQFQYCGGLGGFGLAGLFWSPSGRYFYYTDSREGVADGCGFGYNPISRVDTADWTAADLGGGPLSPDGTLLAAWYGHDLVVYEIDGGEIGRVEAAEPDLYLGPIAWSPDGRSLAYVQAGAFCVPGQSGETTVTLVDLPGMASRVLVRSSSPAFQEVKWDEPGIIDLYDDNGGHWRYDLAAEELTAAP